MTKKAPRRIAGAREHDAGADQAAEQSSQNMFAEAFSKDVRAGICAGERPPGSAGLVGPTGRRRRRRSWRSTGSTRRPLVAVDGSGLARENRVTRADAV